MGRLEGQVAIVTGSTSGMGAAIARRFSAEGAAVVVNSSSSVEAGEALAAELADAVYVQADVAREEQARRLVEVALERWGRLDVLVNNAGVATVVPHRDLEGLKDEDWQKIFGVNLMGPWYLMRAAATALRADGGGAVVNISSGASIYTPETISAIPYTLSKAALNRMTELLANVLGPEVRVNTLAPGGIETEMWARNRERLHAHVSANTLLRRPGHVDEIAEACLFLALPGFITGQVLLVDGGQGIKAGDV